jgi:hypothetical protein
MSEQLEEVTVHLSNQKVQFIGIVQKCLHGLIVE